MALPRILVLVLAGGAGGRLELLTEQRAKPAVPFAGMYRLIDFPLSNCQHSGIPDVWVSVQFHPTSLSDHLANGRPWDLDRTSGGLMMLPPFQGTDRGGWVSGTANLLWRQADLIREYDPDALVVVSSDAVYKLDYREVVEGHGHADVLSLEVSLDGRRLVTNGGTSSYANDAVRDDERSTSAHATVEIDGYSSSEVWASFRVGRRAHPFDVSAAAEDGVASAAASQA